jgi:hypothetical protein
VQPPTADLTSAWLAFLTPLAIAVLALVHVLTAYLASKKADEAAKKLAEVHDIVAASAQSARGTPIA